MPVRAAKKGPRGRLQSADASSIAPEMTHVAAVGAVAALTVAACAYQVIRGDAPFGLHRIAVVPFRETVPVGMAGELGDDLVRLLAHDGVQVARGRSGAQAVLSGTILSAITATSPTAGVGAPISAYGLTVRLRAVLVDAKGHSLWHDVIAVHDDFLPSTQSGPNDALTTEANRRRALERIAQSAAEAIHQRLSLAGSLAPGAL